MYGYQPEQIIEVELVLAEEQIITDEIGYWGWYCSEDERFLSFIQDSHMKLWICFPGGLDEPERQGRGKAYRLVEK